MLVDRRIAAGVNLDGKLLADDDPLVLSRVAEQGLDRPCGPARLPHRLLPPPPAWPTQPPAGPSLTPLPGSDLRAVTLPAGGAGTAF
jgi:hypothetical protein